MAKMFYSLEEAAQRLGKSEDDVRQMVESNQLQEFRDGDRLVFKRDQVDLLAGDGDEEEIPLADDEPMSMDSGESGTGLGLIGDTKDETGISIFDIEGTDEADPSAQTVMSETAGQTSPDFSIDPMSSGSGLLDLTQEADDSTLGEDLLKDVYGEDDSGAVGADEASGGALFETTGAESDVSSQQAVGVAQLAVPIDGTWSGIAAGLSLGMILSVAGALAVTVMVMAGLTVSSGGTPPAQAGTVGLR